jgi:thioredoxin reductase (NADPH)
VQEVLGDKSVHAVRAMNTKDGSSGEISCTGVFAYVGLEPACEFVPAAVGRDANGFLLTDAALLTSVPGLFAAGAVRSGYGGLLRNSMDEGVSAAQGAKALISAQKLAS